MVLKLVVAVRQRVVDAAAALLVLRRLLCLAVDLPVVVDSVRLDQCEDRVAHCPSCMRSPCRGCELN